MSFRIFGLRTAISADVVIGQQEKMHDYNALDERMKKRWAKKLRSRTPHSSAASQEVVSLINFDIFRLDRRTG